MVSSSVRNMHEYLFICIADELGSCGESFCPCLFDDCASGMGCSLVHGGYAIEIDVLIQGILQSWGYVVCVIVAGVMVASMRVMLIMAVTHRVIDLYSVLVMEVM